MRKRVLIIVIALFAFCFLLAKDSKAGSEHNVYGWAWSSNIGWISFNNTTGGGGINYGVNIGDYGDLSGFAWSSNIGWITFNEIHLSGCPSGDCRARVDFDGNMYGWARAYRPFDHGGQTLGGWTGWIRLDGIEIDTDTGDFSEWAWGGNEGLNFDETKTKAVIGWISFNCVGGGPNQEDVCSDSDYKVETDFSFIPIPEFDAFDASYPAPCIQSLIPRLEWQTDAEMPYDYEIQFCSNSSCSGSGDPLFVRSALSTNSIYWAPTCSGCCDIDPYNKIIFGGNTYSAQVRARNIGGKWSDWQTSSFTTYQNCWPHPKFLCNGQENCSVLPIEEGTVIRLSDASTVAGPANCSWTLPLGSEVVGGDLDSDCQIDVKFINGKDQEISLRVTDVSGYNCSIEQSIDVQLPLPEYREVAPFSWLKNILVATLDFFNGLLGY